MTKYLFLLMLFGNCVSFAAKKESGFLVEADLYVKTSRQTVHAKKSFILDANNTTWNTFASKQDGVLLLGRKVPSDSNALHFEFIVLDSMNENSVISTPSIITKLGHKAEISINTKQSGDEVRISVLAKETNDSPVVNTR